MVFRFDVCSVGRLQGWDIRDLSLREAIPRKNLLMFGFFPNGLDPQPPVFLVQEGPASQPKSTHSRCKNLQLLLKNSDPPKLGPNKNRVDHSFQKCLDTWCQNCMVFFVRWLFVSRNGIKMQILSVVGFKSSTLTVYCLSSWFIHKQPKTYSNLCVLYWLSHLSWFQGPSIFHPLFGLKSQIMTLSQKFLKCDFLGHFSFTQLFHDVERLRRKHKIIVEVIRRFWYVQHVGLIFLKIHQKPPKLENLGMLPSSRF